VENEAKVGWVVKWVGGGFASACSLCLALLGFIGSSIASDQKSLETRFNEQVVKQHTTDKDQTVAISETQIYVQVLVESLGLGDIARERVAAAEAAREAAARETNEATVE